MYTLYSQGRQNALEITDNGITDSISLTFRIMTVILATLKENSKVTTWLP